MLSMPPLIGHSASCGWKARAPMTARHETAATMASVLTSVQACDVRRDADPRPVALLPVVGVATASVDAVQRRVAGGRVDDRDVAENPDADVLALEAPQRFRAGGPLEELRLAQDFAGRRGRLEIVGEQLPEALDVAL